MESRHKSVLRPTLCKITTEKSKPPTAHAQSAVLEKLLDRIIVSAFEDTCTTIFYQRPSFFSVTNFVYIICKYALLATLHASFLPFLWPLSLPLPHVRPR